MSRPLVRITSGPITWRTLLRAIRRLCSAVSGRLSGQKWEARVSREIPFSPRTARYATRSAVFCVRNFAVESGPSIETRPNVLTVHFCGNPSCIAQVELCIRIRAEKFALIFSKAFLMERTVCSGPPLMRGVPFARERLKYRVHVRVH